jgi:DNA-binding MarR family transcriptional regulator
MAVWWTSWWTCRIGRLGVVVELEFVQDSSFPITEHDRPPRQAFGRRQRGRRVAENIVARYFLVVAAVRSLLVEDDPSVTVEPPQPGEPLTKQDFEALARFRFGIRRYLRFSEEMVRRHGVTPQQYQLMLALKGFPGRDWALVRELADRLQLRHHSVVELVSRAQNEGYVERTADPDDARAVRVSLTEEGERLLGRLSALHRDELRRMNSILAPPEWATE